MRLKASFTVENSIIIPLFTIIIVALCLLTFVLHDHVIIKNACFQSAIILNGQPNELVDRNQSKSESMKQMNLKAQDYIDAKTILAQNVSVKIEQNSDVLHVTCTCGVTKLPFIDQINDINRQVRVTQGDYVKIIRMSRLINTGVGINQEK